MYYEENQAFMRAIESASQFSNPEEYPVPIKDVINNDPSVKLFTFGEFAKMAGVKRSDVFKIGQSYEAFHFKKGAVSIIVYNTMRYGKRVRFTLAHEYGHIKLNHAGKSIYDSEKSDMAYTQEEFEADIFASSLLFPLHKRYEYRGKSSYEIANAFNISFQAVKISMFQLEKHIDNGLEFYLTDYKHRTADSYINFLREYGI